MIERGRVRAFTTGPDGLASIVGASRESLNRALGTLRDAGTIDLDGRAIVVRSMEGLRQFCTGN